MNAGRGFSWLVIQEHKRPPHDENRIDIDLAQAARRKLVLNAEKYPVRIARGRATKYDKL